jgi:hypothetical protein
MQQPEKTPPNPTATPPEKALKPEAQFHFQSPCNNSALVTQVWNKALDACITVSPRELLAVSTDMRKRFREFTTSKRVPGPHKNVDTGLFDMLFTQLTDDGQVAAGDAASLRTIRANLGGKHDTDCVIDNGSCIVAAQRKVWERLGAPAQLDMVMRMESSHGTVEKTIGVVRNYPIYIGTLVFYIQLQISDSLPCEVLLGRPFFMLTSAITQDYPNGTQDITLHNPNSGEVITIATQERVKRKRAPEDF